MSNAKDSDTPIGVALPALPTSCAPTTTSRITKAARQVPQHLPEAEHQEQGHPSAKAVAALAAVVKASAGDAGGASGSAAAAAAATSDRVVRKRVVPTPPPAVLGKCLSTTRSGRARIK